MPAQALPVYHSIFGLGLLMGGSFGFRCAPALASFAETGDQQPKAALITTASESMSGVLYEPTSPELTYGVSHEQLTEPTPKLTLQPVPSLRTSARAIRPTKANLNESDRPNDGDKIAIENTPPLKSSESISSELCRLPLCGANTLAPRQEKAISDESTAAAAQLIRLLSQPAVGHVGQAEIPVLNLNRMATPVGSAAVAQVPDFVDALPGRKLPQIRNTASGQPDDELGSLRLQLERSRQNEDLGILRLLQTAQAPPPPPREPIAFLAGRLGFFDTDNALRTNDRLENQIYQTGLSAYFFPKLSKSTSLYASAEASLGRYERSGFTLFRPTPSNPAGRSKPIYPNYNQLELELGLRQRLAARTYAQIGLHNQQVYSPGFRDKIFGINYIEAQVNHRSLLNSKAWLDSFYEIQLGFAQAERNPTNIRNPKNGRDAASRLRQTLTLSLNYAATKDLRTSLLYQLNYEDYTQTVRNDFYQQVLGVISYSLTPESRLSLFAGTRFGQSSEPGINLDDTFYGAGLNVVVPFF